MFDLVIIGAGPCGVMAAIQASKRNKNVLLIEQNEKILKKFAITGNGRCNITNNKNIKDFLEHVDNKKAFYPILKQFSPQDIINYFKSHNIELKEEDNNRLFPVSNKSSDLVNALANDLKTVQILLNTKCLATWQEDSYFTIKSSNGIYHAKNLLLATGGKTIKALGNNIENYQLAQNFTHTITKLIPQECPISVYNPLSDLMGISLRNTNIIVKENDKVIERINGDILFTHFGLSGPAVLNCSFAINKISNKQEVNLTIELLNMNYEQTREYILAYLTNNPKQYLRQLLNKELPKKLVTYLLEDINEIKNAELNKQQIKDVIHKLANFNFKFKSFFQPENAFLTGGGVSLKEVNLKKLESKLIHNLFIGGELLDVCGKLGGYNLTIALACGHLIGNSIE